MLEIKEKREDLKGKQILNQIGRKSSALLLCIGNKLRLWCATGHTSKSVVTAGVLPFTADGEHLLRHH